MSRKEGKPELENILVNFAKDNECSFKIADVKGW